VSDEPTFEAHEIPAEARRHMGPRRRGDAISAGRPRRSQSQIAR
jgi:hypothetical protein